MQGSTASTGATGNGNVRTEDEGGRCPFLLEHDDSKIVICMCNYYSLGQAELARALLQIIASRNLAKALRCLRKIIWYGPPKHWLCSVLVPSSAHLAWLCFIDFQDLIQQHLNKPAQLPRWLVKHLEFDVLIAHALLDGAAIYSQVLTAEVASELREYHAGLLCATSADELDEPAELQVPATFKLPALSLLQVTNQVSPFVNFLTSHTIQRQEQIELFSASKSLSKAAVQQLYDLCRSQPLLGRCICLSLSPPGCAAALPTARRIQQMYLGLTADALLQSFKSDAWRYLKFIEVNDTVGCPQSLLELLSVLLVVVVSDVRPTPALHGRLQALVSMATSTSLSVPGIEAGDGTVSTGAGGEGDIGEVAVAAASRTLAASFTQALPAEGSAALKPWDHLRRLVEARHHSSHFGSASTGTGQSIAGSSSRSSALHYSSLLKQIRGDAPPGADGKLERPRLDEDVAVEAHARLDRSLAEAWEEHSQAPLDFARNAFLHRTKIYEAFLAHTSGTSHSALRLFSSLEDKLLRLKSSQASLPPAFELLQLLDPATYSFKEPPITFWDAYFEFTRVAGTHCLEYVMETASGFIKKRDFCTSAWLLAPFPQLKPLVVLLCWEEFRRDVESLQQLLDTLWKSYTQETLRDSTKVGDLLVDFWVEVLNYRLSAAGWISKVVVEQAASVPFQRQQRRQVRQEQQKRLKERKHREHEIREQDDRNADSPAVQETVESQVEVAADVLDQVTSHSILYVMRPNLPLVDSRTLLSSLHSLPQLRQAQAALEHSYDLDLARCYYTVRCAMYLVESCVEGGSETGGPMPGHKVIEGGIHELDSLISSIERDHMKVSVFLFISSLCFARHHHLSSARSTPNTTRAANFLVPPGVLLSLLVLLRHHLQPLAASGPSAELETIQQLQLFAQETIWRIFICLKDYIIYSQLAVPGGFASLAPAQRTGDLGIAEGTAREWATAVGAVIVGDMDILGGLQGAAAERAVRKGVSGLEVSGELHPLRQLCTPMEVPLSLLPCTFIPRMLACPATLLQRSLKMNDYALSWQLLNHFPALQGDHVEMAVRIAEQFKELRQLLETRGKPAVQEEEESESKVSSDASGLDQQLEDELEACLAKLAETLPAAQGTSEARHLLGSLSRPLLAFYVLVDLAVSAAPFSQMSTFLLKKATHWLVAEEVGPGVEPVVADAMRSFFQTWVERLCVLIEVRPELRDRASLASIILGIETLPSEPALLKSHLNRLHTQRHAILSLVESVDLVKKGQTSASQRTLVDFLSSAITSNREEEDSSKVAGADAGDREDAVQISEGLGSSRYLLRFLEYLARVADLMHSASQDAGTRKPKKTSAEAMRRREAVTLTFESSSTAGATAVEMNEETMDEAAGVTKLFDVLAEPPKGIVARLLFELGGHRQALALSEITSIDIVEVIVNASFKWNDGELSQKDRLLSTLPRYPMSMEVVQYLAQHERALPRVRCSEAPLLATLACLECRGQHWPSWPMLRFAKEQSRRFPALHRWVEERWHTLRAIRWADARSEGKDADSLPSCLQVTDDASETESAREGSAVQDSEGIGYTEEEFAKLDPEDQLALQAAGDDQEASMSAAFTKLVNALIAEERYEVALQACDEYLPVDSDLTDQVLHLYLKSPHEQAPSGSHESAVHRELLDHECMYRVKGHTLAAQLTLDRYKRWDVDTAVQTLSMCLHRIENEPSADSNEAGRAAALKQELRRILQRMVSFEKILQVSDGRWQVWQEIEDMSKMQVGEAVEHLLSLQQHDMARTLAQMYGMTDPLHSLELSRLHYLFTTKHDKTNAVNRLLSLPPSQAVSFALQLLDMFDVIQHRALLCQMLLKQLQSWLTPGEEERLRVLLASLQLLGEVSETMRPHFLKLLRKPELIVESLLMNARVDLLKKFLEDFPEYRHDELILRYARKALALQPSSQTPVLTEDTVEEEENDAETRLEAPASPGHRAHQAEDEGLGGPWCLTGSPRKDLEIRSRHHFEEAPNSGLTERILELCSDSPDNAAACFHICDELSLRLYDLTPKSGPGKTLATSAPWQPGMPLTSVRLLTFLIRRLLSYLQGKFAGAGAEVQLKLERSLKNLDFIPRLWHVSGRKVGLAQLCDPKSAAELRDGLVAEDHLALALELCKRCSGEQQISSKDKLDPPDGSWHISADPVREAKAVAFQRLRRFEEARQEYSMTDDTVTLGAEPRATERALTAFEDAMRYPPLYDLSALEQQQSIYTFNSLQRKLYRSTATMASLPMFLLPGSGHERGREQAQQEVPVVPISKPPDKWMRHQGSGGLQQPMVGDRTVDQSGDGCDREGNTAAAKAAMQLTALEDRLQDAVCNMRQRTRLRRGREVVCNRSTTSEFQETTLANAVTFLTPPIHPVEMSRWSTLTDMVSLRKTTKARHANKIDAMSLPGDAVLEEPKPLGGPALQSEEKRENKERLEEPPPSSEADQACDPVFEEEEEASVAPDVSYDKLTMDMSSICCGCSSSQNLRSPSNLWPEDRETHSIMPASPMALPSAAPLFCAFSSSSGRLSTASFYELLCFQENYGSAESLISLLVRERRLAQACQYIFNEKADKRLFVDVVAHHCLAHNQFHELQKVILDFDPSLQKVQEYLNSVKEFLRDRRALDLLYSYEVFTRNFVNAGFLAISLFVQSSTWDARVGHLQNAEAHLGFAHRKLLSRKKGEGKDGTGDGTSENPGTAAQESMTASGDAVSLEAKMGIADIKRNLETVRIQRAVCEAMPTSMPQNAVLFGDLPAQCEVAELLMVNGHFKLALKVIEFLDLPAVELCIRASNQIATHQARCSTGSIAPVVKFLEAIPKLPPVEWDSLVSNVVNIWIIEKEELKADRSAASQLVPYIQDERCKMDALILIGNLTPAFQIAQRLGSMQDVLHINSRAQASGDQELLKQIATFMAYNPIAKKRP